jgi:hypothetical protein
MSQFHQNFITVIIDRYGLELEGNHIDSVVVNWLQRYDSTWIVKAIIESLFRGRYKIKSVDNILKDWQRLSRPFYQFTPEYERGILQSIPQSIELSETPVAEIVTVPAVDPPVAILPVSEVDSPMTQPIVLTCEQLNPEEAAPFYSCHHSVSSVQTVNSEIEPILGEKIAPESVESAQPSSVVSINCQSAKHQLFNRLKTIIDPNQQQVVKKSAARLVDPDDNLPCIPDFQLPIELEL